MSFEKAKKFFGEDVNPEVTSPSLSYRGSLDCLLPLPKNYSPPGSPIKELPEHQTDVIYSATIETSKKLKQFFGEEELAVVGMGSTKKLGDFYGVPIKTLRRYPSNETLSPEKEEFHSDVHTEPEDISVHQIQQKGLKAMIRSVFPLFYFIAHLLAEQTAENCLFVLDVVALGKSEADWHSKAAKLYETYFTPDAVLELNVTYKVKQIVKAKVDESDRQCFQPAVDEVMVLLDQSFAGFKKADLFSRMANDLGILHLMQVNTR
jgi:hypothetical protein